jgi:hypothetical protein
VSSKVFKDFNFSQTSGGNCEVRVCISWSLIKCLDSSSNVDEVSSFYIRNMIVMPCCQSYLRISQTCKGIHSRRLQVLQVRTLLISRSYFNSTSWELKFGSKNFGVKFTPKMELKLLHFDMYSNIYSTGNQLNST